MSDKSLLETELLNLSYNVRECRLGVKGNFAGKWKKDNVVSTLLNTEARLGRLIKVAQKLHEAMKELEKDL